MRFREIIDAEQNFRFNIVGLKPETEHTISLGDVDVSGSVKQEGKILGQTLRTDINGVLDFTYYYSPTIDATSVLKAAAADKEMISGVKSLTITSPDNTSKVETYIAPPASILNEIRIGGMDSIGTTIGSVRLPPITVPPAAPIFDSSKDYDYIQTFYADPEKVNRSPTVSVSSIELFFKAKPDKTRNASGKPSPGVTVRICEVRNDEPVLNSTYPEIARAEFDDINAFSDASFGTVFSFNRPVLLETGRSYGVVIVCDDPGFVLWENVAGDNFVGTAVPSPGSNLVKDGRLFRFTNANQFRALNDRDLKFTINIEQYIANTASIAFRNNDMEFLTVATQSGKFLGGEYVWQRVANDSGTVAMTAGSRFVRANTANFTTSSVVAGDRIVLWSNTSYQQLVTVESVTNATHFATTTDIVVTNTAANWMRPPSGVVHEHDFPKRKLVLRDSNANTTVKFAANANVLTGEDSRKTATIASIDFISADRVKIRADLISPSIATVSAILTAAYFDGSATIFDIAKSEEVKINNRAMYNIKQYDGRILSRSIEVDNAALAEFELLDDSTYVIDRKSLVVNANFNVASTNTNLFTSPVIQGNVFIFVSKNIISNTYTALDANSVVIDTEVAGNGTALARHITKKVTFANNKFAEDVRMYMTAYRPANTDIKVYVRLHNPADPEAFDDKAWSPLEYKDSATRFSSSDDENDFIEYELGLPQYSESANVLPGTFTTQLSNAVITAAGVNPTSFVANNDLVKVYNPLIPEDYVVGVVVNANTTSITLGDAIANNNLVGNGFKVDRLKYYHAAFNNITTDNVARYYSTSMTEYDKFNAMQIKIVLLSDASYVTPKVDAISVIGVSA
jgi:hypothetical protein